MNRLVEIGFQQAGHWLLHDGKISCELSRLATQRNILYAFVCDGEVKYIGKTVSPLATRMSGYRNPSPSQTTNIRNNARIAEMLATGAAVDIYALPDNGLLHYGRFHVNLAAGLEDDLIRVIDPPWNGGRKEIPAATDGAALVPTTGDNAEPDLPIPAGPGHPVGPARLVAPALKDPVRPEALYVRPQGGQSSFTFVLQPTYHRTGFFNVGVSAQAMIGADGETIEIYAADSEEPLLGKINRTANQNSTPRIMGGTGLRDWFQSAAGVMDTIHADVLSPTAIRLRTR
jgi:hypothetical protein